MTGAAVPPSRRYRRARLGELAGDRSLLADGRPVVEQTPWLPSARLEVPPLAFGETDFNRTGIAQTPGIGAGGTVHEHQAVPAFLLHGTTVHRKYGILTVADNVVHETLDFLPLHAMPGTEWDDAQTLRLPEYPCAATVPAAFHLLACNIDNYAHWLWDAVSRFDAAEFHGMAAGAEESGGPVLLIPPPDTPWKRQSLDLIVGRAIPRVALTAQANIVVRRLLYLPALTNHFNHHLALLAVFDRMRAAAYGEQPARPPWRRVYVSRADSGSRPLINETEVVARVVRAGFTPVALSTMTVAAQVRLFAEASHIVAAHGAGLANLGFCRPGAAVLELHMDCYVQWAMRCMAALRRLRYGCLVGTAAEPRSPIAQANSWRLDTDALDAALADPRFVGAA